MRFVKWWVRFCEQVLGFEYPANLADVTWGTFFKKLLTDSLIDTSILLIATTANRDLAISLLDVSGNALQSEEGIRTLFDFDVELGHFDHYHFVTTKN